MDAPTSVQELTGRACVRAVSPKKWARLVKDWVEKQDLEAEAADRAVAAGLLYHIAKPRSSALLIGYLSQALESGLFTAREFALALLVHYRRNEQVALPTSLHAALATAMLANPTGLDPSQPFPSPIALGVIPDIGTSASAEPEQVPALELIIPMLRQCAAGPASAQVLTLSAKITALVPAFPAPPLEAGLEAAQLASILPEEVSKPLRDCLSGLMSDLPMPVAQPAQGLTMFGDSMPILGAQSYSDLVEGHLPTLASMQGANSLPIHQMAAFVLEYVERAEARARGEHSDTEPPSPASHLTSVVRLGRALTKDPQVFVPAILDAAITRVVSSSEVSVPGASVRAFVFFTEQLPVIFAWWSAQSDPKWPFPSNLQGALATAFLSRSQELNAWFQSVNTAYTTKSSSQLDAMEESTYVQPEGWSLVSLEAAAVRRYVSLGLLEEDGATTLCGSPQRPTTPGESLLERIASSAPENLDATIYFACHAAGAGRAFGAEVVNMIASAPHTQPPEDFMIRLASSPDLLALVTGYITPSSLLDLCVTNLLDHVEDISVRQEDPQSCLTRFGAGVILVEALCSQYELALPGLLYDSRLVTTLADLGTSEQSHLNSWVKALFGSDGIDDEVILATSSQGLCRLASTLVQQAIIAAMSGQIDLDTLHSGLSYFAQPLLSWCLGGVVGWLCTEIERQGPLSAMHLNVLQTLVLDTAFPEPLLRANVKALTRLLDPLTGLEAVFESSSFGAPAIQDKIQSVGATGRPAPPSDTASLLAVLRSGLHTVRQLELVAPGWEVGLLDTLIAALRSQGALKVLESVASDILYPVMEVDPLVQFLGFVSVLELPEQLAHALVDGYLPSLFNLSSPFIPQLSINMAQTQTPPLPFAARALYKLLKSSLLAMDVVDSETADHLASHLHEEITFQRARPPLTKTAKRAKDDHGHPQLEDEQRRLISTLVGLFEGDEELRARWPALAQ